MPTPVVKGIKGFLGTSLIDYPGKVAAVVFLAGCNLRCPFCHNHALLEDNDELEDVSVADLVSALERRRKLLEGAVITGGEPTLHPQLPELLRTLRTTGLAIKLDTNGMRPEALAGVLRDGLVDDVAVDVKVAPERYPVALGAPPDAVRRLEAVVRLLRGAGVAYEYRTTCAPGLVGATDIETIARFIAGAPRYYLQQYQPVQVPDAEMAARSPYPPEVLERFAELAAPHVGAVALRNV